MKRIPVVILGAGGVGSALIEQLVSGADRIVERIQCRFSVVSIVDSKSWLWHPEGLTDGQLLAVVEAKRQGQRVNPESPISASQGGNVRLILSLLEQASRDGLKELILVDVTAVDGLEPVIDRAVALGYGVVLANKKALAGSWSKAKAYYNHPRIRHESTVGGGQPVIATLRYLLDVNDPVLRIEGQLSGTLGFICGRLDEGMPFSEAVAAAKAAGYTEPDPREDLSGKDVMRKVLILGRMAGWPLGPSNITVESLYPPQLADMSVDRFLTDLSTLDDQMRRRANEAAANGAVLRYVAELGEGRGTIGLKKIPANSPLANLKYISFRTLRYNDEPLLIGGKGAGVEMTAAGVLGDLIDLARETPS